MNEKVNSIKEEILNDINSISSLKELGDLKVKYLGKKGLVTELTSNMRELSIEEKKELGKLSNEARTYVTDIISKKETEIKEIELAEKLANDTIDISLPSEKIKKVSRHPFNRIIEDVEDFFVSMGYDVVDGPELETDENCFQRLNVPLGHPARDSQDTFYIDNEYLLRTQTSSVQARTMQKNEEKKPIRMICPGKVYRRDDDATHSHQFGQVEGLVIDKDISLADLKGTLELFAKKMLGENTKVRFRPSFFPFTEPSVEVDVSCFKCGGKGCSLCKQTGWIEVLGAGMVHPNVLRMGGYDPEVWTGFAFGTGLDRFAMFRYAIPDIRYLYTNDIRFLEQFDRKDEENEIK